MNDIKYYTKPDFFYEREGHIIIIYGSEMHRFFFSKYDNDEYHEFCHVRDWRLAGMWKRMQYLDTFFVWTGPKSVSEEFGV